MYYLSERRGRVPIRLIGAYVSEAGEAILNDAPVARRDAARGDAASFYGVDYTERASDRPHALSQQENHGAWCDSADPMHQLAWGGGTKNREFPASRAIGVALPPDTAKDVSGREKGTALVDVDPREPSRVPESQKYV